MKFDTILNPVDGSSHSEKATRHAIELARQFGSKIILLHCHARYPAIMAEPYFQQAVNKISKKAEELVQPYQQMLEEAKVAYDTRLLERPAGERIVNVARIEKVDLIVMGSRGVSDFEGLILGSVAHQVLHKAQVPVYIAK